MQSLDYAVDESIYVRAEQRIRSVALLLESCSDGGNEPLEGTVARAFADILKQCADDVALAHQAVSYRSHEFRVGVARTK